MSLAFNKETVMEKSHDNLHADHDDLVVLGTASVETKGRAGLGEVEGGIFQPGIADD